MDWIQNILVVIALVLAVWILYAKFFKKETQEGCGDDNCGCH